MKFKKIIALLTSSLLLMSSLVSCSPAGPSDDGPVDGTGLPTDVYASLISLLEGEISQLRADRERDEAEYSEKLAELESLLAEAGKTDAPTSDTPSSGTVSTDEPSPFTYKNEDGGAVITAYSGNYSVLVIPEKLGDGQVTAIADSVFSGNTKLTSVSLPQGIKKLGWFAFSGCTSLKSIHIPDSVTEIGYDAFAYCTGLTIYCSSGSYAESFAKSYGIGCVTN